MLNLNVSRWTVLVLLLLMISVSFSSTSDEVEKSIPTREELIKRFQELIFRTEQRCKFGKRNTLVKTLSRKRSVDLQPSSMDNDPMNSVSGVKVSKQKRETPCDLLDDARELLEWLQKN